MTMHPAIGGLLSLLASTTITITKQRQDEFVPSNLFIGGLGYAGSRIASAVHDAHPSIKISGTVRSKERRDSLLSSPPPWLAAGGSVHVLDVDDEYVGLDSTGVADLIGADAIVQTIAPIADFDRDPLLAFHGESLLGRRGGESSSVLKYVAYISSTGVYGDHNGEWVAEEEEEESSLSPPSSEVLRCVDAKSLARVRAEKEWGELERRSEGDVGSSVAVRVPRVDCFRCGGIYGPGRGPLFSPLESLSEAVSSSPSKEDSDAGGNDAPPPKYVNRIVVDDICSAILSGLKGSRPYRSGGRAYNLVDDDPAPRRAVVAEARRLILATKGNDESNNPADDSSSPAANVGTKSRRRPMSRGTGNKRCSNARLKREYGWAPGAPSFREGLASLLDELS